MNKINQDNLPETLSFSTYWKSRECLASGLKLNVIDKKSSGRGRDALSLAGIFFHNVIDSILEDQNFTTSDNRKLIKENYDRLVEQYRRKYPSVNFEHPPAFKKIEETLLDEEFFSFLKQGELAIEKKIKSKDGLLVGKPDLVQKKPDGWVIIDYKLSSDRDKLSSLKNFNQLHFYACILEDNYGSLPKLGHIVGLDGVNISITIDSNWCSELASEARELSQKIRKSDEDLFLEQWANPSPDRCWSCKFKPFCKEAIIKLYNDAIIKHT